MLVEKSHRWSSSSPNKHWSAAEAQDGSDEENKEDGVGEGEDRAKRSKLWCSHKEGVCWSEQLKKVSHHCIVTLSSPFPFLNNGSTIVQ